MRRILIPSLLFTLSIAAIALAESSNEPPGCAEEGGGEVPVAIHSSPPGAHLRFVKGGETVTRGRTPFARVLPAGEYEIIATIAGGKGGNKQEKRKLALRSGEAASLVIRFD